MCETNSELQRVFQVKLVTGQFYFYKFREEVTNYKRYSI